MNLRTPLGRVRGLGSAKTGLHHWWGQRLSALALIPLGLWFVTVTICLLNSDYASAREGLSGPVMATVWVLFLAVLFYHAQLGMQVVLEDYLHCKGMKIGAVILMKLIFIVLGLISIIAVLRIALGN